jgi:hypothetical protein
MHHSGAKEPPLNSRLNLERWIREDQLFEVCNVPTRIRFAPDAFRERQQHSACVNEVSHLLNHTSPVFRDGLTLDFPHLRTLT